MHIASSKRTKRVDTPLKRNFPLFTFIQIFFVIVILITPDFFSIEFFMKHSHSINSNTLLETDVLSEAVESDVSTDDHFAREPDLLNSEIHKKATTEDEHSEAIESLPSMEFDLYSEPAMTEGLEKIFSDLSNNEKNELNDEDQTEIFFTSVFLYVSDVSHQRSFLEDFCEIQNNQPLTSPSAKPKPNYIKAQSGNEKEHDDILNFYLGQEKHVKRRALDSSKVAPFEDVFSNWERRGMSYRVYPKPFKLKTRPTYIDFITNSMYKVFMLSSAPERDIDLTFTEAQLVQSKQIDELTIPYLTYNILLNKAAAKIAAGLPPSTKVDSLVKRKEKCDQLIRSYNDDKVSKYRPFILLRPPDVMTAKFPSIEWENIPRYCFLMLIAEINIVQNPKNALGECMAKTLRIIRKAKEKQNLDFHLILPTNGVIFLFFLFQMFDRMEEYCTDGEYLTLFAAFEVLGINFHIPLLEKETKRIVKNISEGCCLSRLYFELKNSAVSVLSTNVLSEMENAFDYMKGLKSPTQYFGHERIVFQGRRLFAVKFISFEDEEGINKISISLSQPDELYQKFTNIPIIPPLNGTQIFTGFNQTDIKCALKNEPNPIEHSYEHQGLAFKPSVVECEDGTYEPKLSFVPGTYDFFFSL